MSAYAIYVWPCYFLVFVLLAAHVVSVILERRKIFKIIFRVASSLKPKSEGYTPSK